MNAKHDRAEKQGAWVKLSDDQAVGMVLIDALCPGDLGLSVGDQDELAGRGCLIVESKEGVRKVKLTALGETSLARWAAAVRKRGRERRA